MSGRTHAIGHMQTCSLCAVCVCTQHRGRTRTRAGRCGARDRAWTATGAQMQRGDRGAMAWDIPLRESQSDSLSHETRERYDI